MELYGCIILICLGAILQTTLSAKYDEPICTSRFDFEEKLLDKLVRMEHAFELLQERVSQALTTLEHDQLQMKQDFTRFQDEIKKEKTNALATIQEASSELKEERSKLAKGIETMSQQYENRVQRMSQDLVMAINKSDNEKVVFAVQTATGDLVMGVPTFTTVHVNVGGAYSINTGKFTCSVDGIFVFTFILRSFSSKEVYCFVRKNGSNVNYATSEGVINMASVTVYLILTTGDVVDVGGCHNWNTIEKSASSFNGMKL